MSPEFMKTSTEVAARACSRKPRVATTAGRPVHFNPALVSPAAHGLGGELGSVVDADAFRPSASLMDSVAQALRYVSTTLRHSGLEFSEV